MSYVIKQIEHTKLLKGKNALDLGCGDGKQTRALQSLGFDVVSIDVKDYGFNTVDNAETYKPDRSIISLEHSVCRLFDVIIARNLLPYLENPQQMVKNIYNWLTPDGLAYLTFFGPEEPWNIKKHTPEEALEMLAPFRIVFTETFKGLADTKEGNPKHWDIHKYLVQKQEG